MMASAVLDKKVERNTRESVVVTYGEDMSFPISSELLDLLAASTDELRRIHQASSGVAPINRLAKHFAKDVRENGDLLLELVVYARFVKGLRPSQLHSVQRLLTPEQHSRLRKMTIASKSRTVGVTGYPA